MKTYHTQEREHLWAGLALAIFMGFTFTLIHYHYGTDNQVEQLPIVYRVINPSFLLNDFFVNATASFGPRFYFAHFMALLAAFMPLPWVYLGLTAFANVLVAVISFLFGRELFKNDLAGALAACVVMGVEGFDLGQAAYVRLNTLIPATLIMPLILLSIWAAIRQQPVLAAGLAGLASLIHPVLGLETGAIALLMVVVSGFLCRHEAGRGFRPASALAGGIVLIALGAITIVPYESLPRISSSQFIQIVAYFRHPHHYVPSTWGWAGYLEVLSFLIAASFAWIEWQRSYGPPRIQTTSILVLGLTILLLCIGGYIFVELIPSPLWTEAQTFRLLALPKWVGQVLIAGVIAHFLTNGSDAPYAYASLVALLSPISTGVPSLFKVIKKWAKQFAPYSEKFFTAIPALLVVLALLFFFRPDVRIAVFPLFLGLTWLLFSWPRRYFYAVFAVAASVVLLMPVFHERLLRIFPYGPQIALTELADDDVSVAAYARTNTPPASLFLTPPDDGQFRLTAERAIVVDFWAFPFQQSAMLEWQQRLFDCYGIPTKTGFDAQAEMVANYRYINDSKLLELRSKYRINYAVLYVETPSNFPVLYQNPTYKIVAMP